MRLIVNLLLPFALFCSLSFTDVDKQYPEDRDYGAEDRGMGRYAAKSLYQTGKFALTFDDGPSPVNTPKLLDILKEGNVHATFFVMTEHMTEANLPLLKRVLDEGHILASHGLGHIHSNQLDAAAFKKNLKDSFLRLKQVYAYSGHNMDSIYYRFPYGEYGGRRDYHHMNVIQEISKELFGDNCIQFVFWDVDSVDWVPAMTPTDIFTTLKAHYTGGRYYDFKLVNGKYVKVPLNMVNPPKGGVVLQHDIHDRTLEAVRMFIKYAKAQGLQLVTLPETEEFTVLRECRFIVDR